MNKFFTTLLLLIVTCVSVWAQAPQKMTYQSVVHDVNNSLATNRNVSVRIWILQGSAEGSAVYIETQSATTNANGLMTLALGEGTVVAGSLSAINWANGPYFLKTEMDPEGGSNYSLMTVQELLSVPYALYANEAANSFSGDYNDLENLPQIPQIPAEVSAFTNDAGYLTPATVQDAVTIPTNVSAFTNDAGYITATQVPAQVNADWNATDGAAQILNKPTVPAAANNATLTLQQNGTLIGTFTSDASSGTSLNVVVPTATDQLVNDIGYLTPDSLPTSVSTFTNDAGYLTAAQCGDTSICEMANMITTLQSQIGQLQTAIGQLAVELDSLEYARFTCGTSTVKDFDNNIYNTVQLGNQCWMKENLRTTHYTDGTEIPTNTFADYSQAYRYCPNNDSSLVPTYGYLYNWTAVMHGSASSSSNPSGVQGVCPAGWHVPSKAEWTQLTDFVSGQVQYACYGNNLKIAKALASTTGWNTSGISCAVGNNPSTNDATGFAALPTGYYFNGPHFFGSKSYFWSAEQNNDNNSSAWHYSLDNESGTISDNSNTIKSSAEGVRCVRDALGLSGTLPTVTTDVVSDITPISATCGGEVTADSDTDVTARGVCWGTSQNPTLADSHTTDSTGTGSFISILTNLTPNTTYFVRAYATNSVGTSYGQQESFTTQSLVLPTVTTAPISDITYNSATCGGEVTSEGNIPVIERGICWTTNGYPTVNNDHIAVGSGLGSFTTTLTGLNISTSYNVRAYATTSVGTVYGDIIFFTTTAMSLPTVTTASASGITYTTATLGGEVTSEGDAPVTERGICWTTNGYPMVNDDHVAMGSGLGSFTTTLNDLTPGTNYRVRAYAISSAGTAYGNLAYFTTQSLSLPSVTTAPVSDITLTSAVCGGEVTADGGIDVTARGICWSTTQAPTLADNHTTDGTGVGTFTSSITGLTPGTTYFVRAYATNSHGTSYGQQQTFTTPVLSLPSVTTAPVSDITYTTAVCGGEVTSEGDAPVTERGVCWTTNGMPMVNDDHIAVGSGLGSFTATLTGLATGTHYFVRAYAISSAGTVYGDLVHFTTQALSLPTVTTAPVSDITFTTAVSGGEVTADGGVPVTARGICWNTMGAPTLEDSHTIDGDGLGSFTSNITDLTPGTIYFVRAYATNSLGTRYGQQQNFTTPSMSLPIVTLDSVSDITFTSAVCSSNVTSDGNAPVTARGVCWSHFDVPTLADSHTTDGEGTGSFTSSVTGLTPGYFYYVRAYATNSQGTSYSNILPITTPSLALPTVITNNASDITFTSATLGGEVTSEGDAPVTERGICWTTSGYPTVNGNHIAVGSGLGSFSTTVTGLDTATRYYVRAYAISSAGTVYGDLIAFSTNAAYLPSVMTAFASDITYTTVTAGGEVIEDGGVPVTERGVCWFANDSGFPTVNDNHIAVGSGLGSFTVTVTDLTPDTYYRMRAYATNSVGTSYGGLINFYTSALRTPSVRIDSVIDITYSTVVCSSEVTDDGGSPVTARGVCWSHFGAPTLADRHTTDGDGLGSFTSSVTGLTPGYSYFVRAYATNSQGTRYSDLLNFTTPYMASPTVITNNASDITYTTATCSGEVTAEGDAPVTERGICWSTSGYPTVNGNHIALGSGLGSFTTTLTGLDARTIYFVRAYAISSAGTMYGDLTYFTTLELSLPTVTTAIVSDITQTTAVCGGEVTADGGSPVTARGICWSTVGTPTLADNYTIDGDGLGSFTSSITNLTPGTTYYVRAYAINSLGTKYGQSESFTTTALSLPTVTTVSANDITYTSATLGGEVTSEGDAPVTERGICWTTHGYPMVTDNHIAVGSGLGSFTTSLTGLASGTNYFVRAYAISSAGTVYGDLIHFTTLTLSLPSVTTTPASSITHTTAVCGGEVTDDGGLEVTARGVCWGTTGAPNLQNNHTIDGAGLGGFTSSITGLTPGTTYYVRAYAINSLGTMYGSPQSFTTPALSLPTVTTNTVSDITFTTAVCGGEVTDEGDAPVTERGVCWTTSGTPTVNGDHVAVGSGLGSFSTTITGLDTATIYYMRAYAISSESTVYGDMVQFTTDDPDGKPCSNAPTVTDFDGNTYNTVFLGHQCWMKENLRTTHFADGTFIPLGSEVSNTMAYRYVPNNDPTTVPAYGYLYNWYAVMEDDLSSETNPSDVWGICPTGWHVPSIAEWLQLRDYLRSKSKYWCGGDSTNIATALASTTGWRFSNTDYCDVGNNNSSNNSSGFSAFPAGIYSSSNTSENFERETHFWSSTQDTIDSNFTQTIGFENYNERERMRSWRQWTGLSVRCILNTDVETANLPTVTTDPVGNITYTTATCGGNVTDDGGLAVTARGICWGTTPNPTVNGLHTTEGSGTGSFTSSISGLSLGTTYYVRAYATNSLGTMYGQQVTFSTLALLPTVITKPVTSISTTAAVSVGEVTDDGAAAVTARGICWGTSPNPTVNGMHSTEGVDTGLFVSILTNLTPNTTYYVRAYATNSAGTAYGEQMSFTTLGAFVCGTSTISDIDNISYNTVQIGNQCWMKENLRVTHKPDGTLIPTSSASDYYYLYEEDYRSAPYDDENNVPTYGYLYAWKTIMNGAASSDANPSGVQGICPLGWHIPSKAEWTQLIDFATSQTKYVCHGDPDAIAYAFSVNYYWNYSSEWCTPCYWSSQSNISGFSAIPAGYAPHSAFNYGAFFWSSTRTTTSVSYAYDCRILYDQSQLTIGNQSTYFGNSVRCLRDELGESMTLPAAIVDSIFNITPTLASCVSHVTSDGGDSVTDRGVCWSTSPNPTVHDNHTSDGEGLGSFMSDLTDMYAGTTYYVRAYATNSVGTGYGPQVSFTTVADSVYCVGISIPYSNNFRNSDDNVCWSIVDANGDGNTFRFHPYFGNVEYAEYPNVYTPTKADEYLISPTFTFTGNPTVVSYKNRNGHWENVIYEVLAIGPDTVLLVPPDTFHSNIWVRHRLNVSNLNGDYAIAFHCISDAYMGYLEFTDFNVYEVVLPEIDTRSCYELSDFSAKVSGWLISDGGADAEVGFCWSTSPNPTFNDNHFVSNNLEYMFFTDTLTDLTPNTTYYVRAYATNFVGTSFGELDEFTTTDISLNGVPCPDAPTVTDVDNNVYNTVRLGNQCWMKENLRTTHYADNTPISLGGNNVSATTPYRYYPNNNSNTVSTYGYLYNMAAVRHGAASSTSIPSGVQGICPDGWHVPSREEWYELRMFVINHFQVYCCYGGWSPWPHSNAKALASTTGWAVNYDPEGTTSCSPIVNPSTNNATNFAALPAGIRYGNNMFTFPYEEIGWYAQFWSCTQETSINGAVMVVDGYSEEVMIGGVNMEEGSSVRCLRDQ